MVFTKVFTKVFTYVFTRISGAPRTPRPVDGAVHPRREWDWALVTGYGAKVMAQLSSYPVFEKYYIYIYIYSIYRQYIKLLYKLTRNEHAINAKI